MPRLIVVADTNAYIGLSPDTLPSLIIRERSSGIVAWASYFVVDELVARAASSDADRSARGTAALRKLADHCAYYDGVQRVNFLADPRHQLATVLFGARRHRDQRAIDTYGTVVKQIAALPNNQVWPPWLQDFGVGMRDHIEDGERVFVDAIWNGIVKNIVPAATTWADVRTDRALAEKLAAEIDGPEGDALAATMIAELLVSFSDGPVPAERQKWAAETLRLSFPLSIKVFNALLARVMRRGLDVSKPAVRNTLWDMQLGMSVPRSAAISTLPVWLVTGDELIHDAAAAGGASHLVIRLADYLELTRDSVALARRIAEFYNGA